MQIKYTVQILCSQVPKIKKIEKINFQEIRMHAIRHALQRDVFTARDERLLGVVHVTKNGKSM